MKLSTLMACAMLVTTASAHAGLEPGVALLSAWQNTDDVVVAAADATNPPLWRSRAAVSAVANIGASSGVNIIAAASLSRLNAVTYPNLWSFVTSIRAQQQGRSLAVLERNATILRLVDSPVAGAVPLPAAGWLLATGLLGLAAGRLKKRRGQALSCVSLQANPAL
jgi:hypothetical protein